MMRKYIRGGRLIEFPFQLIVCYKNVRDLNTKYGHRTVVAAQLCATHTHTASQCQCVLLKSIDWTTKKYNCNKAKGPPNCLYCLAKKKTYHHLLMLFSSCLTVECFLLKMLIPIRWNRFHRRKPFSSNVFVWFDDNPFLRHTRIPFHRTKFFQTIFFTGLWTWADGGGMPDVMFSPRSPTPFTLSAQFFFFIICYDGAHTHTYKKKTQPPHTHFFFVHTAHRTFVW